MKTTKDKYGLCSLDVGGKSIKLSLAVRHSVDSLMSRRKKLYGEIYARTSDKKFIYVSRVE